MKIALCLHLESRWWSVDGNKEIVTLLVSDDAVPFCWKTLTSCLLTQSLTWQRTLCLCFFNYSEQGLGLCAVLYGCLWVECEKYSLHVEPHACNFTVLLIFYPFTQRVWWIRSSHRHMLWKQTGGGACGCNLLKSLNIHCHGSFDPCAMEKTRMTVLWCGEPRRGQFWGSCVVKHWEQHELNETVCLKWRRDCGVLGMHELFWRVVS